MGTNQARIVITGLFFAIIFFSGYRLSRSEKPYNVIVLTIHKLISVGAFILLAASLHRINRGVPLSAAVIAGGVITALFFLGTIATGAMLTAKRAMPAIVLWLHRITPFVTVVATVVTLYLRIGNG